MSYRVSRSLVASLSLVALALVTNKTYAASGAMGAFAAPHPMPHAPAHPIFRHQRRNAVGVFWPPYADFSYASPSVEPVTPYAPPLSGDVHYTYTYDVPWDWAHRYPPAVTPSARPYVPGCTSEPVTVPGNGGQQTVNVIRCY